MGFWDPLSPPAKAAVSMPRAFAPEIIRLVDWGRLLFPIPRARPTMSCDREKQRQRKGLR